MRKIKTTAALALMLATCGVLPSVTQADVLASLPADALVGVKVANLTNTSNKIAKLAKALGVDAFVPQMQNPLAGVKTQSHLDKGINDQGEIGFAYLAPDEKAQVGEDESFVVLLPVSDYAAFLTNFGEAKTDAGVSEVTSPDGSGKTLYVADWSGGYAALSPAKTLVAKPTDTLKPAGLAATQAGTQDFLMYANFKKLSPALLPKLDDGMAKAMEQFDSQAGKDLDEKYKPTVKAAFKQLFAAAKTFLGDCDTATVGMNIDDAGINTTVLSEFKPDSYLGKLAGGLKNTDKPLTLGLPAVKMLAYGGANVDGPMAAQLYQDLLGPVKEEAAKVQGLEAVNKAVDTGIAGLKQLTAVTFGVPSTTKIGQEALLQEVFVYHGGASDFKSATDQAVALGKQVVADMKQPENGTKPTMEAVQNAKSIEGVSFDSVKFDFKPPADAPNAAMQEQMMNIMYGPGGIAYNYGVTGNDFVLSTGASDETVGAFLKSMKANEDNFSKLDQVKAVAAELPKSRVLEYYFQLDELMTLGVNTANQFGLPVQVQLPPELPPLGVTLGGEGTSLRIDSHLPTATVQSLIAAGMQAFAGMRGGNGGNL